MLNTPNFHSPETRLALEKQWANQSALQSLDTKDLNLWDETRYAHRFLAWTGQKLLLWEVQDKKPVIVNALRVMDYETDPSEGMFADLVDNDGVQYEITNTPTLVHGVFLFLPRFSELHYFAGPKDAKPVMRFSLVARMRHNPSFLHKGATYLTTASALAKLTQD